MYVILIMFKTCSIIPYDFFLAHSTKPQRAAVFKSFHGNVRKLIRHRVSVLSVMKCSYFTCIILDFYLSVVNSNVYELS